MIDKKKTGCRQFRSPLNEQADSMQISRSPYSLRKLHTGTHSRYAPRADHILPNSLPHIPRWGAFTAQFFFDSRLTIRIIKDDLRSALCSCCSPRKDKDTRLSDPLNRLLDSDSHYAKIVFPAYQSSYMANVHQVPGSESIFRLSLPAVFTEPTACHDLL